MQIEPTTPVMAAAGRMTEQSDKLRKAAADFEALLVGQMLRSAREANNSESTDDGSECNSSLLDMAEQQFAQVLANNGGLGIAKMVMSGLGKNANR